jgi:MFS-type transporter involved in bile tolerance (Atg22 family)
MLNRWLARVGLVTPEQRAWAWYDWANSTYFTTVITAVFPSFFATYAAKGWIRRQRRPATAPSPPSRLP